MRPRWKHPAWLILLAVASHATAQAHPRPARSSQPTVRRPAPSRVESDSELTITDSTGAKQTYTLPQADQEWGWFVTDADGHGLMRVMQGRGGGDGKPEVEFEWDGKRSTYTFSEATVRKGPRSSWTRFEVWLPGTGARRTLPKGGDSVTMTFTHLDDNEMEATFNGTTHIDRDEPSPAYHVEGKIRIHRTGAHNEHNGGAWRDCDPIIHDKLIDEEGRSTSECEVKFDQYLRGVLLPAFAPMLSALTASGWKAMDTPAPGPISEYARRAENSPFSFSYSTRIENGPSVGARFDYNFTVAPGSSRETQFYQARDKLTAQFKAAIQGGNPSEVHQRILPILHKMSEFENHTSLQISLEVNVNGDESQSSYEQPPQVTPLPGGYIVTIPYTSTSDDNGPQRPKKLVLLGAWQSVSIAGMKAVTRGLLKPGAPRLSVQNVRVSFVGDLQAADQAINWNAVRELITLASPSASDTRSKGRREENALGIFFPSKIPAA